MNKLMFGLLIAGLSISNIAKASSQDNDVTEVITEAAAQQSDADVSRAADEIDTADVVEQKLADYTRKIKNQLVKQGKQHSVFVYSGTAEIMQDRNDPRWAEYRTAALDKAVLDAQKNYLQTLNTAVDSSTLYSMTNKSGLPTPTKEDFKNNSKMASYLDKLVAVSEGKLDAELVSMGIDPKEFAAATPSIKRDLFKESVVKQVVRTSNGDLAGMMVIKVFEEIRDSGQGSVGAVLALSADKRDQVRAMIDSQGQIAPNEAKANPKFTSIYEMLHNQNDSLYLKVGTQIMYDAKGYPLLISYGQAGVTYEQLAPKRKIERQVAKSFATNNAWASLAQTYNLSGDFKEKTTQENQVTESEQFDLITDSVRKQSSGLASNLTKALEQTAAMTSSVQGMTGVSVGYEWRRKHPVIGHEMVGSVLVWHPKTIQTAVNMAKGLSADELEMDADMSTEGPAGGVNSAESEDIFDSADF